MSDEVMYKYVRGKGWVIDRGLQRPTILVNLTINQYEDIAGLAAGRWYGDFRPPRGFTNDQIEDVIYRHPEIVDARITVPGPGHVRVELRRIAGEDANAETRLRNVILHDLRNIAPAGVNVIVELNTPYYRFNRTLSLFNAAVQTSRFTINPRTIRDFFIRTLESLGSGHVEARSIRVEHSHNYSGDSNYNIEFTAPEASFRVPGGDAWPEVRHVRPQSYIARASR